MHVGPKKKVKQIRFPADLFEVSSFDKERSSDNL
jgi:hypothetical protein